MTAQFQPELYDVSLQQNYTLQPRAIGIADERGLGNVTTTLLSDRPLRIASLPFLAKTRAGFAYAHSFFNEIGNQFGRFLYTMPDPVTSPASAPTVEAVAGGTQAQRDYIVSYAWIVGAVKTFASLTASITIPANNLLKVTVPPYVATVTGVAIYVTDGAAGTEVQQATLAEGVRRWTEPDAALQTGTAAPETENLTVETLKLRLLEPVTYRRGRGVTYDLTLRAEEEYGQ